VETKNIEQQSKPVRFRGPALRREERLVTFPLSGRSGAVPPTAVFATAEASARLVRR
jgi:hypothetical protein